MFTKSLILEFSQCTEILLHQIYIELLMKHFYESLNQGSDMYGIRIIDIDTKYWQQHAIASSEDTCPIRCNELISVLCTKIT